jgi:hypothetical protein
VRPALGVGAVAALVCGTLSTVAGAQTPPTVSYVGTWNVVVREGFKPERQARLVLQEKRGTWTDAERGADPCSGKAFPVTVQRSDRLQLEFTVRRQDVLPACPKLEFKAAAVDATTLVGGSGGTVDDGHGHGLDRSVGKDMGPGPQAVLEIRMKKATGAGAKR